jgi:hypothetical protein
VRRRAKVDGNHAEIMAALAKAGIAAKSLASMGRGWPDAVAAVRNYMCFIEFKVPGGELNQAQQDFRETWPGDVHVVYSGEEAVLAVIAGARHVFERSA